MEDKARAWATRSPNAPVAQIFLADVLLSHGFAIRGTDYAYKVPPDQMTEFKRYIRLARSQLENTKTIASVDPSWYEFMLNIAQYQSWPASQHETLFLEALQREPHFLQTYFVGSGRFSPKWGGSRDELNAFITKAVAGLGPTQSDAMYARIHWWIAELRYFDRFEDAPVDCVRMMRGAKAVVLDYPDQWNINNFALFAVRCQDKNAFDYFAKLIQPKPMMEVWRAPAYFEGAVAWARQ